MAALIKRVQKYVAEQVDHSCCEIRQAKAAAQKIA
jgi:hypothetical protein